VLPAKKKLLIDTNVWLELVRDFRLGHLLAILEKMVTRRVLELIVPETVLAEFVFSRDDVATKTVADLASHIRAVRDALPRIKVNDKTLAVTLGHLSEAAQRLHVIGSGSHIILDRIEALLRPRARPHSNRVWQGAAQRAREGKAPCHHKRKNSIADALIIAAYAEELENPEKDMFYGFVTLNTEDFSKQHADNRLPHDDLETLFNGTSSRYFINLHDALNAIDATVVAEMTLTLDPTVKDALYSYAETLNEKKSIVPRMLASMPIGTKNAANLQVMDLVEHCQLRAQTRSPATVRQDVHYIKQAFKHIAKTNPNITLAVFAAAQPVLTKLALVGPSTERHDTRVSDGDIERLLTYLETPPKINAKNIIGAAEIVRFTLACPIRIGEVCKLKWKHLNTEKHTCEVHGRGGTGRQSRQPFHLHLSDDAWAIIQRQTTKNRTEEIFPYISTSTSAKINLALKHLAIEGVSLDDIRNEGEVRMHLAGVKVELIKAMTGRKNVNPLLEKLTAVTQQELDKLL